MQPVRPAAASYVLIDAENVDWAVSNIVGRKPEPQDRVQFDRLIGFCETYFPKPVRCVVVLNARGEQLPDAMIGFVRALKSAGCEVALLHGRPDQKVVDLGILKLLENIRTQRPGAAVGLASHDGADFAEALKPLLEEKRQVAVLGLREYVSQRFRELVPSGLKIVDLELNAKVFQRPLPRILPVNVDEFDPSMFV
ncbi:NYN domain-containing protein [Corallococcus praedator]|uniref:NYN domain-containing protein n=2 Tax=Corallococcus TaxID=83461 RepID=A0ABR9PZ34_9BACT|nr:MULTISPECIES: NYN domain-containing protein [Corallococcus]MBE4753173.1 NYN domain-containing protein [Corallococcus soli]MCY1031674.1 NYN domain-containing protein [Corallococcus sp. BB11-1]RKH18709.1 NYN domain-containing protein [Corallococcus sp. CA047B]RKH33758.1 NYN domain-containing protein [Corallococcus sp. CA031C]RKI07584.1 NYN domain-containing protein [Corallococcus praedator]